VVVFILLMISWLYAKATFTTGIWLCSAFESVICGLLFKAGLILHLKLRNILTGSGDILKKFAEN
jgi:hypothetical protein